MNNSFFKWVFDPPKYQTPLSREWSNWREQYAWRPLRLVSPEYKKEGCFMYEADKRTRWIWFQKYWCRNRLRLYTDRNGHQVIEYDYALDTFEIMKKICIHQ